MTIILPYIPYMISFLMGFLLIKQFVEKEDNGDPFVTLFLAGGLGLGISALFHFVSLVFWGTLNKALIIIFHLLILAPLIYTLFIRPKKKIVIHWKNIDRKSLIVFFSIIIAFIPAWIYAKLFHPMGGWDAWSAWNLKAVFILTGGEFWKNIFDPILWRSSPHYPLLLPLINVWGWFFVGEPTATIPFFTSIVFSFLTMGLLVFGVKALTNSISSIFIVGVMMTLAFNITLLTSQYCDIVFAYYLLGIFFCLLYGQKQNNIGYILLAGIFTGFLSFTKSEGSMAAVTVIFLIIPYFLWKEEGSVSVNQKFLNVFLATALLAAIPTLLFEVFYSPGNQTFINGLVSSDKPSSLRRLQLILTIFPLEFVSKKWSGLWILLLLGLLLSKGRCFKRDVRIIPLFLFLYLFIVCFYYFLNTHFKIIWWMQVSLNRIIFAILPATAFWVFYSLWREKKKKSST